MHLIVGLGNPGDFYKLNRHNAGFLIVDAIVNRYELELEKSRFKSDVYKGSIGDNKVIVIKPQTFMNNSGSAVSAFERFYKIGAENVIVIYDEIDLAVGKVKVRSSGGDAGHNGIKSINASMENNYLKVRIGVGHPGNKEQVPGYVLSNFEMEGLDKIKNVADRIASLFELLLNGNYDEFNSKVNNWES